MKINKIINNLYYGILLLIPAGWVLNWKYYFSRFISEGFAPWLSIMISVTLVIFASIAFTASQYLRSKKSRLWILLFCMYCVLALYSINCTAAGQYWDQQIKNQEFNTEKAEKENLSFLITQYQAKINSLQKEYDKLNEIRDKTLDSLDDLYYWKNTTKTIEQMKAEIKIEIKEYEDKLEKILQENKVSIKEETNIKMSKTLYIFYRIIFNMLEGDEEKIQFIFQVILSIIIESIAQISIFAFMKIRFFNEKKSEIKKFGKIYTPVQISQNELKHFTILSWDGINRKQSKTLTNKSTILSMIKNFCPGFTSEKYNEIISKAFKKNLIKHDKTGYYPASTFVNQEFFYKKMCEYMKFT